VIQGAIGDHLDFEIVLYPNFLAQCLEFLQNLQLFEGVHFYNLLTKDLNEFWLRHCIVQGKNPKFFDLSFRALINSMLTNDPEKRATMDDIKSSKWYKGPIYTPEELTEIMKEKLSKSSEQSK